MREIKEEWPVRWAIADGVPCLAHRFVEDHTTTPVKVLCEYEDGSLELVPIDKVKFHPGQFHEEFRFLKHVIYQESQRNAKEQA